MLPLLRELLSNKENQIELTTCDKERYQYPGCHASNSGNILYYTADVTKLPHYSEAHFLWSDIQLSKTSTSRKNATISINGKNEEVTYWISKCKGVKKCNDCDHVVPNSFVKNNCKSHPGADLVQVQDCPVEFVYVFPQSLQDPRKWIGGIIRSSNVCPQKILHNHPISPSLSHKLPKKVSVDLEKTIEDNPYLTTRQIASGQGIGYRPGSADIAGTSYGRLDYHRKKALKEHGLSSKGVHVISDMKKIADKVDLKDSQIEGSTTISK